MGYHTEFEGRIHVGSKSKLLASSEEASIRDFSSLITLDKNKTIIDDLNQVQSLSFVNALNRTRRMKRDLSKIGITNPSYFGVEGEFYIDPDALGAQGDTIDDSVLNVNDYPSTQFGLNMDWRVTYDLIDDAFYLEWDGAEKFYDYVPWLEYLIENIFIPKGFNLNGAIEWFGEERSDIGSITVRDNVMTVVGDY